MIKDYYSKPGVGDDIDLQLYNPIPSDIDLEIVVGRRTYDTHSITSGYAPKYFAYSLAYDGILNNRLSSAHI